MCKFAQLYAWHELFLSQQLICDNTHVMPHGPAANTC
jgi:hypothetical protein